MSAGLLRRQDQTRLVARDRAEMQRAVVVERDRLPGSLAEGGGLDFHLFLSQVGGAVAAGALQLQWIVVRGNTAIHIGDVLILQPAHGVGVAFKPLGWHDARDALLPGCIVGKPGAARVDGGQFDSAVERNREEASYSIWGALPQPFTINILVS